MKRASILILVVCAATAWTSAWAISVVNPGFETEDLTGWANTGSVSATGEVSGIAPAEGSFQAVLRCTAPSTGRADLESFFGLSDNALGDDSTYSDGSVHQGGSGIKQTITLTEPGTLSFEWNFLTSDTARSPDSDFSFLVLHSLVGTASHTTLATAPTSTDDWQTHASGLLPAGVYVLGLGVVSFDDDELVESILAVDNFMVTYEPPPPVPDAGSSALVLGIALLFLRGFSRWRRRQGQARPV